MTSVRGRRGLPRRTGSTLPRPRSIGIGVVVILRQENLLDDEAADLKRIAKVALAKRTGDVLAVKEVQDRPQAICVGKGRRINVCPMVGSEEARVFLRRAMIAALRGALPNCMIIGPWRFTTGAFFLRGAPHPFSCLPEREAWET